MLTLQPRKRRQINAFRPRRQRDGAPFSRCTHCHRLVRISGRLCASCIVFFMVVPLFLTITLRCQTVVPVCHDIHTMLTSDIALASTLSFFDYHAALRMLGRPVWGG